MRTDWKAAIRGGVVTISAVLASFGSALLLENLAGLRVDIVILAVALALTLSRSRRPASAAARWERLIVLPVVSVAASQVGRLMAHHPNLGDPLFVLALSAAIWLRRYGTPGLRAGSLLTLPFIAILATPIPTVVFTGADGKLHEPSPLWAAVVGVIVAGWVGLAQLIDEHIPGFAGVDQRPPIIPSASGRPVISSASGRGRLRASSRMAAQMAVALGLAFLVGRWLYPQHWSWMVLSAYIVNSGNRGRGEVVHKSALRIVGAALGTVAATLSAGAFPPGDKTPLVLIFVVLAVATALRTFNYAYWAAGVTAVLSLLNGYFGESGIHVLGQRLGALALGAGIGVAAAWFVLPVRTTSVVRRRLADVLAALGDFLAVAREDPEQLGSVAARLEKAFDQLESVSPALRAHRQVHRRLAPRSLRSRPLLDDAVAPVLRCRPATRAVTAALQANPRQRIDPRALGALQRQVGVARRANAGRLAEGERPELPALPDLTGVLAPICRATEAVVRHADGAVA